MTEKANPSVTRPAEAFKTAGAIAYGGHGGDGFVVDGASPTQNAVQDGSITESNLNTFDESSTTSSFDVTIDPGEAFVYGSWLAIDTSTTVTLASSTTGQTVYVGWNKDGTDDVIVGLASAFSSASGDADQKIPLWDFDTDGTGVTTATDRRSIGYTQQNTTVAGTLDVTGNTTLGGTLSVSGATTFEQTINLTNSDAIQDAGTNAITFDGSQNVTIQNGSLTTNGNIDNNGNSIINSIFHEFKYDGVTEPRIFFKDADGDTSIEIGYLLRGSGSDITDDALRIRDRANGVDLITFENGGYIDALPAERFGLPSVTNDPSANPGDMWYRSDLD